jgi:hypothetical protein
VDIVGVSFDSEPVVNNVKIAHPKMKKTRRVEGFNAHKQLPPIPFAG